MDANTIQIIVNDLKVKGWSHFLNALSEDDRYKIEQFIQNKKDFFQLAQIYKDGEITTDENIRGNLCLNIDSKSPPVEFMNLLAIMKGLTLKIREVLHLDIESNQCQATIFPPTHFFRPHLDGDQHNSSHVISYVFYVHKVWSESHGGRLALYNKSLEKVTVVDPVPCSLVLFLSRDFPHEVKTCFKERLSVAGWLHETIKER